MSTPSEREAREALLGNLRRYAEIEHPNRDHPALTWKFDTDVEADIEMVDAYRTAVRAAVLAECIATVEGMRRKPGRNIANWCDACRHDTAFCECYDYNATIDNILAALRAGA